MSFERLLVQVMLGAFALAFLCFALANRRRRRALVYAGLVVLCVLGSGATYYVSSRPASPAPLPDSLSVYYLAVEEDGLLLHARRARDGHPRWQHLFNQHEILTLNTVQDGILYLSGLVIADGYGLVVAVRANDGIELWRRDHHS